MSMNTVSFPMTSTGRAGYLAPTTLEDATRALGDATAQFNTNEVLRKTEDCVSFLRSQDEKTGGGPVVDALARRNQDLNPEPNVVVFGGSNHDFVAGELKASSSFANQAILQYHPGETDLISSADKLEVNQADGTRLRLTRNEQGAEVIHYMDNTLGDLTVVRDKTAGTLTVMFE